MPIEQLIVGWSRGGLGYVHQLLEKADFDVGRTFGPDITREEFLEKLPQAHQFEISPYVIPYLDDPALDHVRVAFVLRDPMRVLNSLYFHGLFHNEKDSAVQRAAFTHLTGFKQKYQGRPAQAAASYLNHWYRQTRKLRPGSQQVRIEDGPRNLLHKLTGYRAEPPFVTPDVNSSYCKQSIVPSALPNHSKWGMNDLLRHLGYREWVWAPRGGHAHYVNPDWHC